MPHENAFHKNDLPQNYFGKNSKFENLKFLKRLKLTNLTVNF